MSAGKVDSLGGGRYRVSGDLGFESVPDIWKGSFARLDDAPGLIVDLAGVSHVDSAGLALIIEWVRWARNRGKSLKLIGVPEKLIALARISETDGFLDEALGQP